MNAPAEDQHRRACAQLARRARHGDPAGRTLTVARGEVYARDGKHVATMRQTLMMLPDTPDAAE